VKASAHTPFERFGVAEGVHAELVVWNVPAPLKGSNHLFKYRLALIADGICVLRYDNEAGKGDHRHVGARELAYDFRDVEQLKVDFWTEVGEWLNRSGR